jgi:hypothetical protein
LHSNFCHAAPLHQITAIRLFCKRRFRTVVLPRTALIPSKPGEYDLLDNVIAGSGLLLSVRSTYAKIE